MVQTEILEELKKLSPKQRIEVIESAIHLLKDDLRQVEQPSTRMERKRQLAMAANALLPDYKDNNELTIFKVLDGEGFHV